MTDALHRWQSSSRLNGRPQPAELAERPALLFFPHKHFHDGPLDSSGPDGQIILEETDVWFKKKFFIFHFLKNNSLIFFP